MQARGFWLAIYVLNPTGKEIISDWNPFQGGQALARGMSDIGSDSGFRRMVMVIEPTTITTMVIIMTIHLEQTQPTTLPRQR